MKIAVTKENKAPTDESLYTTSIPTATNAGTYYVWYKVVGDDNHNDTAASCITVTIKEQETKPDSDTQPKPGTNEGDKQVQPQPQRPSRKPPLLKPLLITPFL